MKNLTFILLCFCLPSLMLGQKDRYHFAETYFGLETEYISENNKFPFINANGTIEKASLPSTLSPRLLIGGTHFWGHADFYISIPLYNLKLNGSNKVNISNEVFTGFRYLPIQLKSNAISPYFGIGFNSKEYQQKGANGVGPLYTNWQWYKEAGLSYRSKSNNVLEIGVRYLKNNSYTSFIDRNHARQINTSSYSFSISFKKVIDFTSSYSNEKTKRYMQKKYEEAKEKGALSAFSFGLGWSALIPLEKTELASRKAFFNDKIEGNLSLDLGIAYYSNPLDASVRVSYRPLKQEESAYGYTYRLNKHSVALEAFKFIADYHGFVPFVGPYVSIDQYHLKETDYGEKLIDKSLTKLGYGLVFGWDIRQTDVDFLTLRTNLRYTPSFNYKEQSFKFTAKQIEFNFIQLVFYPERYKIFKQKR